MVSLIAIAIGLLAWLDSRGGDTKSFIERPPGPSRLTLVDLLVQDDRGSSPSHSRLEIVLNNTGGRLAVINRARIEIRRVYELPLCFTQGELPLSNTYGVSLPITSSPGDLIEAPLHQQVGADEADRFGIAFSARGDGDKELSGLYIFDLEVSLLNDGPQSPLPLGRVLVALPEVPGRQHYYLVEGDAASLNQTFNPHNVPAREVWATPVKCWRSNAAALNEALDQPSVRSTKLGAIADVLVAPTFSDFESPN